MGLESELANRRRESSRAHKRRKGERAREWVEEERVRVQREWESAQRDEETERVRERHANDFWFSEHYYAKCPCHVRFNDQSTPVSNGGKNATLSK